MRQSALDRFLILLRVCSCCCLAFLLCLVEFLLFYFLIVGCLLGSGKEARQPVQLAWLINYWPCNSVVFNVLSASL